MGTTKTRVIIETPYKGDVERNLAYARACMRHSLLLGESPFASHLLYTQDGVLDDNNPVERMMGIEAGFGWRAFASITAVYVDLGISDGMINGIEHAELLKPYGHKIEHRSLTEAERFRGI